MADMNVSHIVLPQVELVASTQFHYPEKFFHGPMPGTQKTWNLDSSASDAAKLIEFGGRLCYDSFDNPAGRTPDGYIQHILESGHLSVIEHPHVSVVIWGVSRNYTHEHVRHRMQNYSQRSQRYTDEAESRMVVGTSWATDGVAFKLLYDNLQNTQETYRKLIKHFEQVYADIKNRTDRRKKARQAARYALASAGETVLLATGDLRNWRHYLHMRGAEAADSVEMRTVAAKIYKILHNYAPEVFADFELRTAADGYPVVKGYYGEGPTTKELKIARAMADGKVTLRDLTDAAIKSGTVDIDELHRILLGRGDVR